MRHSAIGSGSLDRNHAGHREPFLRGVAIHPAHMRPPAGGTMDCRASFAMTATNPALL
jgi:hypothetical protein